MHMVFYDQILLKGYEELRDRHTERPVLQWIWKGANLQDVYKLWRLRGSSLWTDYYVTVLQSFKLSSAPIHYQQAQYYTQLNEQKIWCDLKRLASRFSKNWTSIFFKWHRDMVVLYM